jgi:hypothetical protein
MAIGRHEPNSAQDTDFPKAIRICFDEAFTALEESFCDLEDAHVSAFPIRHRNNIAWIIMHSLQSLDEYGNQVLGDLKVTGKFRPVLEHTYRYGLWQCKAEDKPTSSDTFPTVAELLTRLWAVRDQVTEVVSEITEEQLRESVGDWRRSGDAAMRSIWHTMAHIRQIWLLRGALGIHDGEWWPRQHWA